MINKYRDIINFKLLVSLTLAIILGLLIIYLSNIQSFLNYHYFLKYAVFLSLSVLCIYKIQQKHSFYLPSFYLFMFFLIIPIFGVPGYLFAYRKLYPDYMGVQLDVKHALDFWLQGTFFIILGIFLIHIIKRFILKFQISNKRANRYISWNWRRFNFMLFLLGGIAFVFSIATILKVGYIPILKGNIGFERYSYFIETGEWTFKMARLWTLVYLFAFIWLLRNIKIDKTFYIRKNLFLIITLIFSFFIEGIYGDRFRQFIMVFFSVIMFNKAIKKIRISYFCSFFLLGILFANVVVVARSKNFRELKVSVPEKIILNTFSEFQSFAYAVQEYPESKFLHGKAFIGTLAPFLPKQVWEVFNLNKRELLHLSSASIMKKIHHASLGIRIGIIGEGFINFGYLGIIIVPLFSGILFGILENIFISLKLFDVKEIILAFAISILMFLPIAQTNALTAIFPLLTYLIIICIIFFNKKTNLTDPQNLDHPSIEN